MTDHGAAAARMMAPDRVGAEDEGESALADLRARAEGTNISPETLLATDYLNHFNEIVMMLDMVPDMPDLVEDCAEWQPKSYPEHFANSTFRDKALAIEAYTHCPPHYRKPFDETVAQMDALALATVTRMQEALAAGDTAAVATMAHAASRALQRLMDMASAIIHGAHTTMDQAEIDDILAG